MLLRLAVCLRRPRSPEPLPPFTLSVRKDRFRMSFPMDWLKDHPLTADDLQEEAGRLTAVGIELTAE